MEAVNLMIGSRAGLVHIVRCKPQDRQVSLKTTVTIGSSPTSIVIDVPNKCFYCLDSCPGEITGQIRTIAPTEFGTLEERESILTGGREPFSINRVEDYLYVINQDTYSILKCPKPRKSTRRRRRSSLAIVPEEHIAESLEVLFSRSRKSIATEEEALQLDSNEEIAALLTYINSTSDSEALEMARVVKYSREPLLKLVSAGISQRIIAISPSQVRLYACIEDGGLRMLTTEHFDNIIDVGVHDKVYLLTTTKLIILQIEDEQLSVAATHSLTFPGPRELHIRDNVLIVYEERIIVGSLAWQSERELQIASISCCPSFDGSLLFIVASAQPQSAIVMYTIHGEELGRCVLESPSVITQMS